MVKFEAGDVIISDERFCIANTFAIPAGEKLTVLSLQCDGSYYLLLLRSVHVHALCSDVDATFSKIGSKLTRKNVMQSYVKVEEKKTTKRTRKQPALIKMADAFIVHEGRAYRKVVPAKTLMNSSTIYEVVARGDFFAIELATGILTVLPGTAGK